MPATRRNPDITDDADDRDPEAYVDIVGQTFIKHERRPVLQIGTRTWDLLALAAARCPHPKSAAALNRLIQQLRITSLRDLADRLHEILLFRGVGVTTYWTALAILRDNGFSVRKVHGAEVSCLTLKAREAKKTGERKRRKK